MKISRLLDRRLCLGCGLCRDMAGKSQCTMRIDSRGFYVPEFAVPITSSLDSRIASVCPAITVKGRGHEGIWGEILSSYRAWSTDPGLRRKAASGGATTAIASALLKTGKVQGVLQVGHEPGTAFRNALRLSRTVEEVEANARSRYAPALMFDGISALLDAALASGEKYCFIGKPCDIAAIENLCRLNPAWRDVIALRISIFCAGMPSYEATLKACALSGRSDTPASVDYRGNGWPGDFKAVWPDGETFSLSYNDSWGKVLGRDLALRCKLCPDGIGLLADIAVGDYWATKDGFPDFTDRDGECFLMARNETGQAAIRDAVASGMLTAEPLPSPDLRLVQPYQYQRRRQVMWRLLPMQLATGFLLKFRHLGIIPLGLRGNWIAGLKTLLGSLRRMRRR